MKIVFVLIILAVVLLSVAIVVFFWAVRKRQFDDLDVHAYSILKEDDYEKASDKLEPRMISSRRSATTTSFPEPS